MSRPARIGLADLQPDTEGLSVSPRYLRLGGALSGFLGGLSGMQGALRSAFLVRAGLSKESFIATGVVVAALIDIPRLGVYVRALLREHAQLDYVLLGGAVLAAFAGAMMGSRWLQTLTMEGVWRIVAAILLLVALGLVAGLISSGASGARLTASHATRCTTPLAANFRAERTS